MSTLPLRPSHMLRAVFTAALLVLFAVFDAGPAESAAKPECGGSNILAELATSDPAAHSELIAAAENEPNGGALLWRVSRDGTAPSYLFGTVHLTDPRVLDLPETISEAIDRARVLALEVSDLGTKATRSAIAESRDLVLFRDGQRLDRILSAEDFARVRDGLRRASMPKAFAPLLKPWVISMILAVSDCERARVSSGKVVLDAHLANMARARGVPVVGLETIRSQLEAAASVALADQVGILRANVAWLDRSEDLRETILQLYLDRRIGAALPLQAHLARKAGVRDAALASFKTEMIDKRNRSMRARALPLLAEGGAVIAVGALHLPGPDGLVALFREAGYTVDPVE